MANLFFLHTTPVTIGSLKALAQELIPRHKVFNILDDSVLPELIAGGSLEKVEPRVRSYVRAAADAGADLILSACSSIGGIVVQARDCVSVPVCRIDDSMAEKAVQSGEKIAVVATLQTTLQPTMELLIEKAQAANKEIQLTTYLANQAYAALVNGDQEKHDSVLAETLREAYSQVDVVVLAQASMARVMGKLEDLDQSRFLTSPRLGMEKVKELLG